MTLPVFYSPDYVAAAHTFDTTRKAQWVHDRVASDPRITITQPSDVWDIDRTTNAIAAVHDRAYVSALAHGTPRHLAESQGFGWDENLWLAVNRSTAGVLSAVDAACAGPTRFAGSLSSGLHHAKFAHGDGFCSVNGLIVAARHAVNTYGMHVVILDVDAHAGGGTNQLLRHHDLRTVTHLDLTTKPYDSYAKETPRVGDVNIEDAHLDDRSYLDQLDGLLRHIPTTRDTLVLHNAGMDPAPEIGVSTLREREQRVAQTLHARGLASVFVLAGGYTSHQSPAALAEAHAQTLWAFADHTE